MELFLERSDDYKRYMHLFTYIQLITSKKSPGLNISSSTKGRGNTKKEQDNLLLSQECQHTQSWDFSSRILLGDGHHQAK